MSQFPPMQPPGQFGYNPSAPMPQRRTSGAAIASLVLGILGCVPLITSLLATILGIMGIRKTRDPMVSGRGLAIAGLVLGLVGILGWSLIGITFGGAYLASGPARGAARQFLTDLDAGNVQAAAQNSTISPTELQALADEFKSLGPITDTTFTSFFVNADASGKTCKLLAVATRGQKPDVYEISLRKTGEKWTVETIKKH